MPKLLTLVRMTATLAMCACVSRPAVPSQATLALYDVHTEQPEALVSPVRRAGSGNSSGMTSIGDFVRSRNQQLQFCYQDARSSNPDLAGSATVGVLLAPDGAVTRTDVLRRSWDGRGTEQLEGCVLSKVRSWKFPPADAGQIRTYSFSVIFTRPQR